jgi:hypothetical protein
VSKAISDADLCEGMVIAMEPVAWENVNSPSAEPDPEDGVRVLRATRHALAAIQWLHEEGVI